MRVLIVEDSINIATHINSILKEQSFTCTISHSAKDVIQNKHHVDHDLIILDLMLPDLQGDTLLKIIREKNHSIPILVLSSLAKTDTRVKMINLGADDYLTKPFEDKELIARVKALQRRANLHPKRSKLEITDIEFFWKENMLIREGKEITLTNNESRLLKLLLDNEGVVLTIDQILDVVWGTRPGYHSNVVQSTVKRLRKKIDQDYEHKMLINKHGLGYKVKLPPKKKSA
jgi:two-component system copper resistance phosphate regulon response regulator CusR